MTTIVRRRRLGYQSVKGVCDSSDGRLNWARSDRLDNVNDDTFIRWGCTCDLPRGKIINRASAIHEVNDKATFRMLMSEQGLAPESWVQVSDVPQDAWDNGVIIRPSTHSRGRDMWLVHSPYEAYGKVQRYPNFYLSRYIPKVAEYRVCIAQGRVVWVAKKNPDDPTALAWNHRPGQPFTNVKWDDWPLVAVKTAVQAFNLSTLDFGAADVIVDDDGRAYVLEINSAPSLTSPYRQGLMAKVFEWLVNDTTRIPLIEERGGYRKFIHPAVSGRALIVGEEV